MAAMASFFDVVYLQDSLCLSCKDLTKQRRLRYSMLSALLAMVELFRALHSLWITLLPFALLFWNVILHALCAKCCAWNRSWLWLQQAVGQTDADVVQDVFAASEASMAEQRELFPYPAHHRGSSDGVGHASGMTEMSIVSFCRPGACTKADAHADACRLTLHLGSKLPRVYVYSFPHQRMLNALDQAGDAIAVCAEELCPHRSEQQISVSEATPYSSKAVAVSASSQTSKLSSICFLQERGPQVSQSLSDRHSAVCASLLQPLVLGDICPLPLIAMPSDLLCLSLDRNRDLLQLNQYKGIVCTSGDSISWSILRKWLQISNGRCVPGLSQGKSFPTLECGVSKVSTSRPINEDNYIIPPYGMTENVKLNIATQMALSDLSSLRVRNSNIYAENGVSGSDSSQDTGSASISSIKFVDECDGAYCTSTKFTTDFNDHLDCLDMLYGAQGYRDDDCCGYKHCFGFDDTQNINEGFVYPATDMDDAFYDHWAGCNIGYVSRLCGTDVHGICSMDYHANENCYANFGRNIDVSDASVYGDVLHTYGCGLYESSVEVHAGDSHTWWDKDAVLLDVKELKEEKIEEDWQVL